MVDLYWNLGQDSQSCPKPKINLKYCFLTIGFVFQQYIGHILSKKGFVNPAAGLHLFTVDSLDMGVSCRKEEKNGSQVALQPS